MRRLVHRLAWLFELAYLNRHRQPLSLLHRQWNRITALGLDRYWITEQGLYGVTDEGRAFLDRHGMLRAEETLHEAYEAVEKPTKIAEYENAPRPPHR